MIMLKVKEKGVPGVKVKVVLVLLLVLVMAGVAIATTSADEKYEITENGIVCEGGTLLERGYRLWVESTIRST